MAHAIAAYSDFAYLRYAVGFDESNEASPPVQDLQNVPLVSLEMAVQPILHLFNSLMAYVWAAKQNCRNPADGLTVDESASIYLYTMEFNPGPSLYRRLNAMLRSGERAACEDWSLYLRLFLTALDKLPSYQCKVWRSLRDVDLGSYNRTGEEIVWWAVSSCTLRADVLNNEMFQNKVGQQTLACIDCHNGKQIGAHSFFKSEHEVILMPGSRFYVASVLNIVHGTSLIELKEIEPPYSFFGQSESPSWTWSASKDESEDISDDDYADDGLIVTIVPTPTIKSNSNVIPPSLVQKASIMDTTVESSIISLVDSDDSDDEGQRAKWIKRGMISTVILAFCMVFPISTLVFGQVFKDDCPIQKWIPFWMTIFGIVGAGAFAVLIFLIMLIVLCCSGLCRTFGKGLGGTFTCLLLVFFLGWLITGSIWVFPIHRKVHFDRTRPENYCAETLYKFIFWTLIGQYTLIGLLLCCGSCLLVFECLEDDDDSYQGSSTPSLPESVDDPLAF